MNTKKHTNNLQKSSVLFLQLGLVLTLFTVYIAFELKTEQRVAEIVKQYKEVDDSNIFVFPEKIRIERTVVKKQPTPKLAKIFTGEIKKSNKPEEVESTLPFDNEPIVNPTPNVLDGLVKVEKADDFVEDVPFTRIQEVPIFPGCEKVKKSKQRACFEKKIQKHIQRKFNSDLGSQLRLPSGVQRIWVEFMITKTGEIEILASRAVHKKLKREGERVVNRLPTMIPGKQNGEEVNVKYMLPIVFNVE